MRAKGSTCRCRLAKPRRGKGNGSVTRVTKPFLRGATVVEACQGSDSEVQYRVTTLRSSRGSPLVMGGLVANVLGGR